MTAPKLYNSISLGNLLTILAMAVAGLGGFFALDARSDENSRDIAEIEAVQSAADARIRGLENSNIRSEERYTALISILSRIEARLQRMEELERNR